MTVQILILILSVFAGASLVWVVNRKRNQWLKLMLSFCGGYLLSISFVDIIPYLFEGQSDAHLIGWFVILGFLIQLFLDFLSGGIEHGHFHHNENKREGKIPYTVFIGLLIHAFVEGLPLTKTLGENTLNSLVWGIALHNLPVSIVLLTVLYERKIKPIQISFLVVLFSLATPAGMLVSNLLFDSNSFTENYQTYTLAVVVGIFLHISTTILFESDKNHRYNFIKIAVIIAGMAFAGLMHL